MGLTSPLCPHSPEVRTVARAEEVCHSAVLCEQNLRNVHNMCGSHCSYLSLLAVRVPERENGIPWEEERHEGASRRSLHCRPHFITNDFTRGLLRGGHRYLPFFTVCFHLFYGGEKMPMLSSSLSPQQIHSADFCMEGQTFKTTTTKCHWNRLKLCSQTDFLPEPQWITSPQALSFLTREALSELLWPNTSLNTTHL